MGKQRISGIVHDISTNPFQTFARSNSRDSAALSFDISFNLVDEDGNVKRVWFQRSFRLPPRLEDGDHIEVVGRQGHLLGLIGRKNFYAIKIIDKRRGMEYTPWRNKEIAEEDSTASGSHGSESSRESA